MQEGPPLGRVCGHVSHHYAGGKKERHSHIQRAAGCAASTAPRAAPSQHLAHTHSRCPPQLRCVQPQHPNWAAARPAPPRPALLKPLIEAADAVGLLVQYSHQARKGGWDPVC